MRENAHQVRLRGDFECAELALHRQDGEDGHRLVEARNLRRCEDRLLRNAVEDQAGNLARPWRKPDCGGKLRAKLLEIFDPVQRITGEQLPRGFVQGLNASVLIERQQRARRIVDDRR